VTGDHNCRASCNATYEFANNPSYSTVTFAKTKTFEKAIASARNLGESASRLRGASVGSTGWGREALAGYRHYRLDGAGNISGAEWIDATCDDDAVRQVRERKLPFESEIWDRNRLVARVEAAQGD
jgi:hypothetical protein